MGHISNAMHAVMERKCCHSISHKNPALVQIVGAMCLQQVELCQLSWEHTSDLMRSALQTKQIKLHVAPNTDSADWVCSVTESMWVNTALVAVLRDGAFYLPHLPWRIFHWDENFCHFVLLY